ncbi:hypothetical protein SEVIR_9G096433v4 [Setaria viridis]
MLKIFHWWPTLPVIKFCPPTVLLCLKLC